MKIKGQDIPEHYLIKQFLPANYCDSFSFEYSETDTAITPDDIQVAFFTEMPGWVNGLFKTRDFIVKPFGLKGSGGDKALMEECIRTGKTYRFASVPAKSDNETVLCLDDSHLRAYMSVRIESGGDNKKTAQIITLVQFKKRLGYVYFYSILPFHSIIVKKMLRHSISDLLKKQLRKE